MKMRKTISIVTAILLITAGTSFGQGFTLKGKINGMESGKVTLQERGGEKYEAGLEKGEFTIKGKVNQPNLHTLRIEGASGMAQLFIENSNMKVVADKNNLRDASLTGSKTHDVFNKYLAINAELSKKYSPLNEAFAEARKNNDQEEMKKLEEKFEVARDEQTELIINFVKENNKSIASAFILASVANNIDDPAKLETAVNSLDNSLSGNDLVKTLKDKVLVSKKTAIGQTAMDFTQNDPDGNPVSLSEFRGKVVLLDFWAAWCRPCRMENPNVVEAYKKFNGKGFTVLGVSLDRTKDQWLKAIEDDGLTWTHVSDLKYWDSAVAKMYGVQSIPANLLIDKNGKIIAKNLRGDALHEKLAEILD
jgi:peroxiredoxin